MPKAKGKDLLRMLALLPYLNRRAGEPVSKLARKTGMTQKEFLRELRRLSLCGAYPRGPGDLIMALMDKDGNLEISAAEQFRSPLSLTAGEVLALRTALMPLYGMDKYRKVIGSILRKLEVALLPGERMFFERLSRKVLVRQADRSCREILETLDRAKRVLRQAEMLYYTGSTEELKRRVVEPYGFLLYGGQWYLVAKCLLAGEVRIFKADRVRDIKLLDQRYQVPDSFDIGTFLENGHLFRPTGKEQEVKIWFSPKVAPYILERNVNAVANRDGSAVLTLRANSFTWVARWVLHYGGEARIVDNEEAKRAIKEIVSVEYHPREQSKERAT